MALSNELEPNHVYFFEYEGDYAIGEYIIEWEENYVDNPMIKYLKEMWSDDEDGLDYYTYINGNYDSITIIKRLGHAYDLNKTIDEILDELKEEFPEYFI